MHSAPDTNCTLDQLVHPVTSNVHSAPDTNGTLDAWDAKRPGTATGSGPLHIGFGDSGVSRLLSLDGLGLVVGLSVGQDSREREPVSYTHLTLPTN